MRLAGLSMGLTLSTYMRVNYLLALYRVQVQLTSGLCCSIVESVKGDVEWVRAHPLIQDKVKEKCQGFVYDIKTGKVEKVDV